MDTTDQSAAGPTYCTRCREMLKRRVVWLSLNCRTGRYSVEPIENPDEDQGAHPFGLACSRRALKG
jgi:hypothetical protein